MLMVGPPQILLIFYAYLQMGMYLDLHVEEAQESILMERDQSASGWTLQLFHREYGIMWLGLGMVQA